MMMIDYPVLLEKWEPAIFLNIYDHKNPEILGHDLFSGMFHWTPVLSLVSTQNITVRKHWAIDH